MTRTLNINYDDQIYNVNYGVRGVVPAEITEILFSEDHRDQTGGASGQSRHSKSYGAVEYLTLMNDT